MSTQSTSLSSLSHGYHVLSLFWLLCVQHWAKHFTCLIYSLQSSFYSSLYFVDEASELREVELPVEGNTAGVWQRLDANLMPKVCPAPSPYGFPCQRV